MDKPQESKVSLYVKFRIQEKLSHSEASRKAGYNGSAPSSAIEVYEAAKKIQKEPAAEIWLECALSRIERSIEDRQAQAREIRLKLRAIAILQE